eukprot:RCo046415
MDAQVLMSRKALIKETKQQGCMLSSEAVDALVRYVRSNGLDTCFRPVVHSLCTRIKEAGHHGGVVDTAVLQTAIEACRTTTELKPSPRVTVVSSFETPKLGYDPSRKAFYKQSGPFPIMGASEDKTRVFLERYELLLQRALRYDLFVKPSFDMKQARNKLELSTISSVEGSPASQMLTILGLLTRKEDGEYYVEDPTSRIKVDLTSAIHTPGLFVEGCFVLAQGVCSGGTFCVKGLGFPPAEPRSKSLAAIPQSVDLWGGVVADSRASAQLSQSSQPSPHSSTGTVFVVLSDVHLTDAKVFPKLRALFAALASVDGSLLHFLFVGSFIEAPFQYGNASTFSHQFSQSDRTRYTMGFDRLAEVLAEFPELASKAHFVFVPGPNDPTPGGFILPQAPIPAVFTASIRKRIPQAIFTSNPCRVWHLAQELVVFRDDAFQKHRRHCLPALQPSGEKEPYTHLMKTMVDQAHLSCVPFTVTPVFWAHDHSLRLFPLPDTVFVCEPGEVWEAEYMDCRFANPGSFAANGTIVLYHPDERKHEFQEMR